MSFINNTTAQWTVNSPLGNNNHYLNNNFSSTGNPLAGAIDGGPVEYDASTGAVVNSYNNGADGAKSALALGSYIFFTGDDTQGIRRIDNDWSSNLTGYQATTEKTESMTTDGTSIYGNDDVNRDQIIKWSVTHNPTNFSLTQQWAQDVGTGGRFRGVSYFDHGSGSDYIYASDGGASGTGDKIWAFDADTGSATAVKFGGTDITVPGTDLVYQAIAHKYDGRTTLTALTTNEFHVWDMDTPTTVTSATPTETYTLGAGTTQLLNNSASALSGNFYGAGAKNNQLFLLHGSQVSAYQLGFPLIISEIMYDPNSAEDDWEWVEVYNSGSTPIDLSGYVLDDNNGLAHAVANIASGTIAAGGSAILFNDDDLNASDFEAAWGNGLNLIGVTGWSNLPLNNIGDKVSLWSSFASYIGDHTTHNNAIETVDYSSAGFPDPIGASIYLTDLTVDNTVGSNWATSTTGGSTPTGIGYLSANAGGNSGNDIGSPGGKLSAVNLSSGTIAAASVASGTTNHPLYQLNLSVTTANAQLTGVTFTTGGTYVAADIVPNSFELFYSTDTTFDAGDTSLGTKAVVPSGNTLAFTGLSQTINSGNTGTLFLVADIATGATAGNTINIATPNLSNITFTFARKTGILTASGAQTFDSLPTVTSITSSTTDGIFGVGGTINVTVNFSENVTLAGGNLTLNLDSGGTVSIAPFTNANSVSATYTVGAGQNSTDLNVTSLTLAGGATLKDVTNNTVTLTIPAGQSLANNKALVIDTTAPGAPGTPDMSAATDTGSSNTDNITNDTTPTFTGTAEANSTVTLTSSVNGTVGTATADGAGNWSIATSTLSAGNHNITATAIDTAGNMSSASSALAITLDTTAPMVTVNQTAAQTDPTNSSPINYTAIFSETVTGFATGDVTLAGTAGATTDVVTGSGTTYNIAVSGMTASGTVIASLAAGAATDIAGNASSASTSTDNTVTFNNDPTAPTLTSITRQTPSITPANADTLVLRATFNEDVQHVDATDFSVTGTTATITGVNAVSGSVYDITVSGGDLANLNGTVGLDVAAGQNITDLSANALPTAEPATDEVYTIDNTAPSAPTTSGITTDTGTSSSDGVTRDNTLVFTGTAEAHSKIEVLINGGSIGTTTADGSGSWSFDYTGTTLADGNYNLTAVATDSAGNGGSASSALAIRIDTTAPMVTVNSLSTFDTTPALTGMVDDRSAVIQVTVNGSSYTGTNNGNGTWVLTDNTISPALSAGTYEVAVTATDRAGNGGNDSSSNELVIGTPEIQFSQASYAANEGDGTTNLITLTRNTTVGSSEVQVNITGGTATGGSDYTDSGFPLTVVFNNGENSKTIAVPIVGDTVDEPGANETILFEVIAQSNAIIVAQSTTSLNIADNDGEPNLSINDVTVNESAGTLTFTVSLDAISAQDITVDYATADGTATAGNDYTSVNGTLTFAAGEMSQEVTVNISEDSLDETDEAFTVDLTNGSNASISDAQGVGEIIDNDMAVVPSPSPVNPPSPVVPPSVPNPPVPVLPPSNSAVSLSCPPFNSSLVFPGLNLTEMTWEGMSFADVLFGNNQNETFFARENNDWVIALQGDDNIYGESGDDWLIGNQGTDVIDGGLGNDWIHGGQDNDGVRGGEGNDVLFGDRGDDVVEGNDGDDLILGNQGTDYIDGGLGDDFVHGGRDNDGLLGNEGNDTLLGDLGDDCIQGNLGDDSLLGNAGDDELWGGQGNDILWGGVGNDIFVLALGEGVDRIMDFGVGDRLGLSNGLSYSQLTLSQNGENTIISINNQILAILEGVSSGSIQESHFVSVA